MGVNHWQRDCLKSCFLFPRLRNYQQKLKSPSGSNTYFVFETRKGQTTCLPRRNVVKYLFSGNRPPCSVNAKWIGPFLLTLPCQNHGRQFIRNLKDTSGSKRTNNGGRIYSPHLVLSDLIPLRPSTLQTSRLLIPMFYHSLHSASILSFPFIFSLSPSPSPS